MTQKKDFEVYFCSNKEDISKHYIKHKEACVEHLSCEKSFVIYDYKNQSYFAVRDIIGLTPLYYTFVDNMVYFEKDIGLLFKKTGVKKEVDFQTMQFIINNSTIPYDKTMYKHIYRVPPGHYLKVLNDGEYTITRYWKPEEIKIDYTLTKDEAEKKFLTLFDQAIFDRIDNLDSTGFELSGGLDSSSIVSWVKYKNPHKKVTAFSMNFKSMKYCDESKYVDAMQKKYDIDLQIIPTDKMDYKNEYSLENNYKLNPYWPIFITYTMGFSIIEKAKITGKKTILTGQGGDNILAGNLFVLHHFFKRMNWWKVYKEIRALPYPKNIIKRYLLFPLIGEKNLNIIKKYLFPFRVNEKVDISSVEELSDLYKGNSSMFKMDIVNILHSSLSVLMESSYYNVIEKKFGIRFRHPFFDRKLIEFSLSLPPHFKYSEGVGKRLLRISMKDILPDEIRERKDKAQFTEVLRQQINAIDLNKLLQNTYLAKLGLIEQEKIDLYKEDYLSGKMKKVIYFWQLINLEYWYRYNFIDNYRLDN
jgi:asparagine synthase (glutamine-hydrolysing)